MRKVALSVLLVLSEKVAGDTVVGFNECAAGLETLQDDSLSVLQRVLT